MLRMASSVYFVSEANIAEMEKPAQKNRAFVAIRKGFYGNKFYGNKKVYIMRRRQAYRITGLYGILSGGVQMKKFMVQRSGWNTGAALAGPFWYLSRGVAGKGLLFLLLCLATLGIGIVPIWIYCGFFGNRDFYRHLKRKGVYIWE